MKIIAHRGASFYAPENTVSAFELAMKFGVDGLEMDVHMTKDKKVVIIHDDTTGRTGTRNLKVNNSKFDTLQKIDVGSWFGSKFKGEKIPSLEYMIQKTPKCYELYIEIKSGMEIVDTFYHLMKKYEKDKERLVIFSFNYDVVVELKKRLPDYTVLWIVEYGYNVPKGKQMYKNVYDKISAGGLDGISTLADLSHCIRMAGEIKNRGWVWNVWTVDNPHLAKQFMNLGVTSLSTNRPDWIMKHLS